MKVLIFGPFNSGHIQNWIDNSKNEIDYRILTLHKGKSSENVGLGRVYSIPRLTNTKLDFLYAPLYLLWFYYYLRPDLVHVHFFSSYGVISSFLPRKAKKVLSVWGSDINNIYNKTGILNKLYSRAMSKFSIVNSPALHLTKKIKDNFKFPEEKIKTFQYGIDVGYFSEPKFDKKNSHITITSVRNWDELYNVIPFLKSILSSKLNYDGIRFKINILGRSNDDETKFELSNLVKACNNDNVEVNLIGFVDKSELKQTLLNSDFVLSIPIKDGAPLSLMEGMICRCFPIVSKIDANEEILGDNAIFIDINEKISFEKICKTCIEKINDKSFGSMIEDNFNLVKNEHDKKINTELMIKIYKELVFT